MRLLSSWLSNIIAIYVASWAISAIDYGDSFWILALTGLVFGLVNLFIRPLVILLALPAVILSLGLGLFLINALMLYLTSLIVPAFQIGGFWSALGGAVIIFVVNFALQRAFRTESIK